jgi:acetyl-CoA carboxylase biotin carboxyl carrier protein
MDGSGPSGGGGNGGRTDPLLASLPSLIEELARHAVVELEVSVGEARLYLRQRPGFQPPVLAAAAVAATEEVLEEGLVAITTPLTGVYYAAPSPDDPPYVREGEEIEAGQVVALIEAMKVFNEIHADVAGEITAVLVQPGQQVQTGQPLFKLRPTHGAGGDAVAP